MKTTCNIDLFLLPLLLFYALYLCASHLNVFLSCNLLTVYFIKRLLSVMDSKCLINRQVLVSSYVICFNLELSSTCYMLDVGELAQFPIWLN